MVYMLIPFVAVGCGGASAYACARMYNASKTGSSKILYGYTSKHPPPYPWPPFLLDGSIPRSNTTMAGNLLGFAAFLAAFKLQRGTIFRGMANMRLAGAPTEGKTFRDVGEFAAVYAMPFAALSANVFTSSAFAGLFPPLLDGDLGVPRGAAGLSKRRGGGAVPTVPVPATVPTPALAAAAAAAASESAGGKAGRKAGAVAVRRPPWETTTMATVATGEKGERRGETETATETKEGVQSGSSAVWRLALDKSQLLDAGSRVRLVGLKTLKDMNGQSGVVVSFNEEKGRYDVEVTGECDMCLLEYVFNVYVDSSYTYIVTHRSVW